MSVQNNKSSKGEGVLRRLYNRDRNLMRLLAVFILVFILLSLSHPGMFLQAGMFQSMAFQFPEYGLLAIGIGLTMLTGGIDLSAVSIANLSGIMATLFMVRLLPQDAAAAVQGLGLLAAVIVALITGAVAGRFNALLISRVGIPPILATLGTQQLFSGFAIVLTKGKPISGLPMSYAGFMNSSILGIPVLVLIFAVAALLVGFILSRTVTGRRLYLLGANPRATRYAGMNNNRLYGFTYMWSGIMAAISGLIMIGRANSAKADYGAAYTLQCILIAVLGGIDPNGGRGNVQGVVMAVLILQMLSSGLNMFENVSNFYRDLLWGALLLIVLVVNFFIDKGEQRRASR